MQKSSASFLGYVIKHKHVSTKQIYFYHITLQLTPNSTIRLNVLIFQLNSLF